MNSYWQSKRAVVTGASAGLGRALAAALCDHGARVVMAARRIEPLEAAAASLGDNASAAACDVTRDDEVLRLAADSAERLGGIDLWVNAAGKSSRGAAAETSLEDYRALWELNFLATVRCSQAALPHLRRSSGHLVNIGSLASKLAPRWLGAYPASKFPVAAFCQQLRLELSDTGVHVLLVCPGPIARQDAGQRYDEQAERLPPEARKAGGGARVKSLDPRQLSEQILEACRRRRVELVAPAKARLLAAITQLSPSWGDWLLRRRSG